VSNLLSFLDHNSLYIVLFILLVIWFGIFMFLLNTDKRLKRIEEELNSQNNSENENNFNTTNSEIQNEK